MYTTLDNGCVALSIDVPSFAVVVPQIILDNLPRSERAAQPFGLVAA